MSTDIHMYAEVMNHGKGVWEKVGKIFPGDGVASEGMMHFEPRVEGAESEEPSPDKTDHPYSDRNYGLFGILSGSRRGGVIISMGKPRGIPEDASRGYKALATSSTDWHSHSWWTVAELIAWPLWQSPAAYMTDSDDPIWHKRYVLEAERARGKDEMTEEERKAGSARFFDIIDHIPHRVFTARDIAGTFYSKTIPSLLDLGHPEDVRILWFYDN